MIVINKKKIVLLFLLCSFTTLTVKAQSMSELMDGYDNKYALEHMELYTKEENKNYYGAIRSRFHRSIKLVNLDATWLNKITNLIEEDPTIMYPYLDNSNTQNLAAYILLASIFDYYMPLTGSGDNLKPEAVDLNILKRFTPQEDIDEYAEKTNIPAGEDPFAHMINSEWGVIAIPNGVNERLKTFVNNR